MGDGPGKVISGGGEWPYDGRLWQFLGYTGDDGFIAGDIQERFYINDAGERVEIAEPPPPFWTGQVVTFTVPLRDVESQLPVLSRARPRCRKCSAFLAPCTTCGHPAQCGEAHCAGCQPG